MLRKITHIIFALFLLISTMGMTVSMHYCGDKLVSASINKEAKSCCESGGCCHNETIQIDIDDDYVTPVVIENNQVSELTLLFPAVTIFLFNELSVDEDNTINFGESPPPKTTQKKLSLLQTYRC